MAISIDWSTSVINVNKADMVLIQSVPSVIYRLDLDVFRLTLKDLEDTSDGMSWLRTHTHNTSVSVGGAVLARVIQIINGYTVTFEDGQYRVETVGANSNIGSVVNVNQVSVSTSNSAGLQDLNSLQAASFNGEVSVNKNSSYSGTTFPVGTRSNPVNNMADADAIADARGLQSFHFKDSMTLTGIDFSDGHTFRGDSASGVTITVDASANVTDCTFEQVTVQGSLDKGVVLQSCAILDITDFNGYAHQCAFFGTTTIAGAGTALVMSCYSGIPLGSADPFFDMGVDDTTFIMRDWQGGMQLKNLTGSNGLCIDLNTGRMVIDASCTSQTASIPIRGVCQLFNNGTSTVVDNRLFNDTIWDYTDYTGNPDSVGEKMDKGLTRNQFVGLK